MGLWGLTPKDFAYAKVLAKEGSWADFVATIDHYIKTGLSPLIKNINVEIYFSATEKMIKGKYKELTFGEYEQLMHGIYAAEDAASNKGDQKRALVLREIYNMNDMLKYLVQKFGVM